MIKFHQIANHVILNVRNVLDLHLKIVFQILAQEIGFNLIVIVPRDRMILKCQCVQVAILNV